MVTALDYINYLKKNEYSILEDMNHPKLESLFDRYSILDITSEDYEEDEELEHIVLINKNEQLIILTCEELFVRMDDGKPDFKYMFENTTVSCIEIEIFTEKRENYIKLYNTNPYRYLRTPGDQWVYQSNKIIEPHTSEIKYVIENMLPNIEQYKNQYIQKCLEHRNYIVNNIWTILTEQGYQMECDFLYNSTEDEGRISKSYISLGYIFYNNDKRITLNINTDFVTQKLLFISDNFVYKCDIIDNKLIIEESLEYENLKI